MDKKETNELKSNIDNEKNNLNDSSNEETINSLSSSLTKLNVMAPVFVPSFAFSPDINNIENKNNTEINSNDDKNNDNNTQNIEDVVDDWEANADEDDDEEEEDDEELEETAGGEIGDLVEKPKHKKVTKVKKKSSKSLVSELSAKKEHLNIVFIGHVDAGKSTIGGQLLYLTGMVDKRTLEKYEREAKEKNRESWYLSWALDTNQEERDKGKTVEVGRAYFETQNKNFTLLDAPGHRGFVPNMIGGASQADLSVLVISARKGEFETGFERGGQTREHAMLAKTAGVKHMVVLINKMDDPTVKWSEDRYNECCEKLLPYLKKCGFNPKNEIYFMPCSGLTGAFLKEPIDESICHWYRGPSFLEYIDCLPSLSRNIDGPFRLPVVDKYKDMGTVIFGKVESGQTQKGAQLILMPNRKQVEVLQLWSDEYEVNEVSSGQNVKIKLKGAEEEEVTAGFVLCDALSPCNVGKVFDAQVAILEHKSIICPGYSAVLHIHCAIEEVSVKTIIDLIDKKTGKRAKVHPRFVKQDQVALMRLECSGGLICMEPFSQFQQMGRFTLRDEGKTIAIGKVLRVVE